MPTEREFREWERKRKQSPRFRSRRNKNNFPLMFLLGLIIVSAWIAWKDYQSNDYSSVSHQTVLNEIEKQQKYNHVIAGSSTIVNTINYDIIDQRAFSIIYDGSSVSELAAILSQNTTTQAEKARIIYAWIADNIDYDVSAYLSGDYGDISAKGVLENRRGVCSGYANLYQALAREMGLETVVIEGYAKGLDYSVGKSTDINHAWNAVKIDNAWYLLDSTWGAGTVKGNQFNRQFHPHYFATSPSEFIYDHLPVESVWQLLSNPYSKQQFESLPEVSPAFFQDGIKLVNPTNNTIVTNGNTEVILQVPSNINVIARISQEGNFLDDTYTLVQSKDGYISVQAAFPAPGTYELEIFSSADAEAKTYPHAVTYKVITQATGTQFPRTFSTFLLNKGYLYTPVTRELPDLEMIPFQIAIDNAVAVEVVDESSNNRVVLERQGNLFSGYAQIGRGKTYIIAKFPENGTYWTLVEYN